MIKKHCIVS